MAQLWIVPADRHCPDLAHRHRSRLATLLHFRPLIAQKRTQVILEQSFGTGLEAEEFGAIVQLLIK